MNTPQNFVYVNIINMFIEPIKSTPYAQRFKNLVALSYILNPDVDLTAIRDFGNSSLEDIASLLAEYLDCYMQEQTICNYVQTLLPTRKTAYYHLRAFIELHQLLMLRRFSSMSYGIDNYMAIRHVLATLSFRIVMHLSRSDYANLALVISEYRSNIGDPKAFLAFIYDPPADLNNWIVDEEDAMMSEPVRNATARVPNPVFPFPRIFPYHSNPVRATRDDDAPMILRAGSVTIPITDLPKDLPKDLLKDLLKDLPKDLLKDLPKETTDNEIPPKSD